MGIRHITKNRILPLLIWLSLHTFIQHSVYAEPQVAKIYNIEHLEKSIDIPLSFLSVISDSTNSLNALDVALSGKEFRGLLEGERPTGNITYWVKLQIKNMTDRDRDWLAYAGKFFVKEMYNWDGIVNGDTIPKTNGRLIPYSQKDFKGFANFDNPIQLFTPKGKVRTYLFKLYSPTDFYLKKSPWLILYEPIAYRTEKYFSNVIGAFVVGGLTLISIYHLMLFFFVKERMYLSFIGLLFFSALFFAYYHGFTIEFLWQESPLWDSYSFFFILAGLGIYWLRFSKHYLTTNKPLKPWRFLLNALQALHFLPPLCGIYDLLALSPHLYLITWANQVQIALILFTQLFIFVSAIIGFFLRVPEVKAFFLANFAALLGGILLALQFFRVIPYQDWVVFAPELGFLFMAVIFSYGLGKKIVNMRSEVSEKTLLAERMEREKEVEKKRIVELKNRELERKVIQRTSEIAQQKEEITMQRDAIEMQNSRLKILNDEKNNLIHIVAHDLKSPLHQINGLMYILDKSMPTADDTQQEILGMVTTATDRLSTMITNLLDINAIESGTMNMHMEKFPAHSVASNLKRDFANYAQGKGVTIHENFRGACHIKADKMLLYQVFENLVSNAIKFSPINKDKSVHICLEELNGKMRFSVRDEGDGISPEDMPKLFEKFQKLSSQPTGGESSTGLGLSIVKKYVEVMNGKAWCESVPKQGASFFVEFPLEKE